MLAEARKIVCTLRLRMLINVEPLSGRSHVVDVWVCDRRLWAGCHLLMVLVAEDHVCDTVCETDSVFEVKYGGYRENETKEEQTNRR